MAYCKLCLVEKKLIKKSHIYPEFFYTDLYGDDHSMVLAHMTRRTVMRRPLGEYEANILCRECESLLSRYESYGKGVLYGGMEGYHRRQGATKQYLRMPAGANLLQINGLDYKRFKLFLLSIVWRASISKREVFSRVSLGEHEERIRQMLITENPRESNVYPCVVNTYE